MTEHEARTVRKYRIADLGDTNMVVVIGLDDTITEELAHEINNFWSDADDRLDLADGNVFVAVATLAGERVMRLALEHDSDNAEWIQRHFQRQEGWPPSGVTVHDIEDMPAILYDLLDCAEQPA